MGLQNGSQAVDIICVHLMCTHTITREILNFWKALDPAAYVSRSETPAGCATRRELAPAAQLHRQPCQGSRHDPRAMDRTVPIAAAGRIIAGRSGRRA